ncbi:MAG: hypothetical protein HOV71_18320 [Hamadaea sp.]|nr:hypothetical protein [Hamadaea sp.]NUR50084.1 hypothetical protein [Hamadaea sp.]NUT07396.1 hypothetical protein [Hamadaea sp.]
MAAEETKVDPARVSRLASATLDLATALSDAWRKHGPLLTPATPRTAPRRAAEAAAAQADLAVRRIAEVMAADADRLWQTAFAYEAADDRAAWRMGTPGRRS